MNIGTNDIDQIFRVLQIMGTPSDTLFPKARDLPDFCKIIFPEMLPLPLETLFPSASIETIAVLKTMLQLNPEHRLSASNVLKNNWIFFFGLEPVVASVSEQPRAVSSTSKAV